MAVLIDPEKNETRALFGLYGNWHGKSVLEVGSGDGRLTWRYAKSSARVLGIEPDLDKYSVSVKERPSGMEHVQFVNLGLDEFAGQNREKFNLVILAWSL